MKSVYDFKAGDRGARAASHNKTRITIRLDDDILQWFRDKVHQDGGGSYQTLINGALREFISSQTEPFEDILRRVLREELHSQDRPSQPPSL